MQKPIIYILSILLLLITMGGCSVTHNVNIKSAKAFKKDLVSVTNDIKSVEITFTRPAVTYKVKMVKEPKKEVLDAILEKAKTFTTVENMDEIAKAVGWKDRVTKVNLFIDTDNDDAIEYEYFTSYYKTAMVRDTEENIDAYQTWK